MVWGLWNEGNLFSLSVPELQYFLQTVCGAQVDTASKKSALVRQVEEIMSAEQVNTTVPQEDSNQTAIQISGNERATELFEEADLYGDWGAEPGFEERRDTDYMELSPSKMGEAYEALSPRAFQLLHDKVTSDIGLTVFDPSKLPGQKNVTTAYGVAAVPAAEANQIKFRKGLQWCVKNLWAMNIAGEVNIGAGKALYWREVAKHNRSVLPLWTCQHHLYHNHPFQWFAVAHESCTTAVEALVARYGMTLTQEPTTSYKVCIKKGREMLDCELNSVLRCTQLNKPWDRFLMTHYLRHRMPDLRYLVRARHPIRKRVADAYLDADILRSTRESVQSVLAPELGEVIYTCERVTRKWSVPLPSGITLQCVETKRTPLIVTRPGDEGTRLEYELIAQIPPQSAGVDMETLSSTLWEYGNSFAEALEETMQEMQAHTMPTSAAFEPL